MISLLKYHKIGKKQEEVNFLIPFLDLDRRYFLDPSLLRFSGNTFLKKLDTEINDFLDLVKKIIAQGDMNKLNRLLKVGEASDAGLGYCLKGVGGSGWGKLIAESIGAILRRSPDFIKNGLFRIEELQWLDVNVGPDTVSDACINILKRDLISYTQKECKKLGIPLERVRVERVFYPDSLEWGTMTTSLPVNPYRRSRNLVNKFEGIVFIPKEALKKLPLFLNYNSFYGFVDPSNKNRRKPKSEIVERAAAEPDLSKRYINYREAQVERLTRPNFDNMAITNLERLRLIKAGTSGAKEYRQIITELLNFLFDDLELKAEEQFSFIKDKKRDIIFINNATSGVLSDMKIHQKASHIVIDAKNSTNVTPDDISRLADYLNDDIGRVGLIVARKVGDSLKKHQYSQLKEQKKVILFFDDEEIRKLVGDKTKIRHTTGIVIDSASAIKALGRKYSDLLVM